MKKGFVLCLCLILVLGCFAMPQALADRPVSIYIDGEEMAFEVAPVIVDSRAMVPMRAIFEQLGAQIEWDPYTATVTAIAKSGRMLVLQIGNPVIRIDGQESWLEVSAFISHDRTLVPARAVSEGLLADVSWDAGSSTAVITSQERQGNLFYRTLLSEKEQQMYDILYLHCLRGEQEFEIPQDLQADRFTDTFWSMFYDCPEFFWLDSSFSYRYSPDGLVKSIQVNGNGIQKWDARFYQQAEAVLQTARGLSGDLEKVRYIHDMLAETVDYDLESAFNQSAFSAIVTKKSVCAGYARAFEYYMQQLGIPCTFVEGTLSGGNHAWNLVKLNGAYYNVDVTNDDLGGVAGYYFFLVSDASIQNSHQRTGISRSLPASLQDYR